MKQNTFTLLFFLAFLVFGCKKTTDPAPATKTDLISRSWQVQTLTVTLGSTILPGYTRGAGPANIVDLDKFRLAFKADGSYTQTEADGTVYANSYTWKFGNNETQFLLLEKPAQAVNVQWDINDLTVQNLNFSRKIAANSTDPADLSYLALIQSLGLSTAAGATLSLKTTPAQ